MKLFLALCLVAVAAGAPAPAPAPAVRKVDYPTNDIAILNYENDLGENGFRYAYEQTDGTKQEQEGAIRNQGTDDEYIEVKGSYSWVGPDGVTYIINYTADQDGYKPEIEQGPGGGVPPAVVASLLG